MMSDIVVPRAHALFFSRERVWAQDFNHANVDQSDTTWPGYLHNHHL